MSESGSPEKPLTLNGMRRLRRADEHSNRRSHERNGVYVDPHTALTGKKCYVRRGEKRKMLIRAVDEHFSGGD